MRYFLLFLLLLIIFKINFASPVDSLNYLVKHYSTDNGLSQNSVKGIAADETGFIWLATEAGLTRFDGQSFKNFDRQMLGTTTQRITFLYRQQKTDRLCAVSGLNEFISIKNGSTLLFKEYAYEKPVYPNGQTRYTTGLPTFGDVDFDNYEITDRNRNTFVARKDSVFYYNQSREQLFGKAFKQDNILGFFLLDNELLHLNKEGLLRKIDRKGSVNTLVFTGDLHHKKGQVLQLYWNLGSRDVFIYSDKNLYRLSLTPNAVNTQLILPDFDFAQHHIMSIYYDSQRHSLFLGSLTKGLYVFEPRYFDATVAGEEIQQSLFYAMLPYSNQVLSSQGYVFDSKGKHAFLPLLAPHTADRYTLAKDNNGHIWTTTGTNLFEFDSDGKKLLNTIHTAKPINRLVLSADGKSILLGCYGGDLIQYDIAKKTLQPISRFRKEITWLGPSKKDKQIWVGTIQGLYKLNLTTGEVDSLAGLEQCRIRSLYEDQSRQLWICTEQRGPFLFENNTLHALPLDQNGYLKAAHCFLEDRAGYFWISTNNGLFRVYKKALLDYTKNRQEPIYTYYNKDQGFLTNEFNGGCQPCGITLANGDFALPSMRGVVRFNPLKIKAASLDHNMIIDEIDVDGKYLPIRDTLVLNHDFSQLKITVKTPYFGHANDLRIQYQISGTGDFSAAWIPLTNGKIILSKLPSGIHRIAIRKVSSSPDHHFSTIQVVISIPPLFYETWWFIAGLIIILIMIVGLVFKLRVKRLQNKNTLLKETVDQQTLTLQEQIIVLEHTQKQLEHQTHLHKRLSASISHDVKTPLRFIGFTLQKLQEQLVKEQHPLADMIADVQIAANGVHDYALMLTDYSKYLLFGNELPPRAVKLRSLINEKIKLFRHIADQKGIRIKNEIPTGLNIVNYEELLSIVFHNLLDNAIKFTLEGTIQIKSNVIGSRIKITIEDSGMGMSSRQVNKINAYISEGPAPQEISTQGLGLKIAKDLITIMQGWMRISSTPKIGTIITIELPNELSSKEQ